MNFFKGLIAGVLALDIQQVLLPRIVVAHDTVVASSKKCTPADCWTEVWFYHPTNKKCYIHVNIQAPYNKRKQQLTHRQLYKTG